MRSFDFTSERKIQMAEYVTIMDDGVRLQAVLEKPEGCSCPLVIFLV